MKTKDIVVGGTYSNGKVRVRKVIAEGQNYIQWPGQDDTDCVCFEIVSDGRKTGSEVGRKGKMTRRAFAAWAKERVDGRKEGTSE